MSVEEYLQRTDEILKRVQPLIAHMDRDLLANPDEDLAFIFMSIPLATLHRRDQEETASLIAAFRPRAWHILVQQLELAEKQLAELSA